jgi:hypothetical protein
MMLAKATRLFMVIAVLASMALSAGAGIKWDNLISIILPTPGF